MPAASDHKDYSGTPLPKKLGVREGSRVAVLDAPREFTLEPLPPGATLLSKAGPDLDVAVLFVTRRADLERRFVALARRLVPDGRLWVAWPKKASKVSTDLTFEVVQRHGLDAGLVDNKSASIDDVFQGVQFVPRRRPRSALTDAPRRRR